MLQPVVLFIFFTISFTTRLRQAIKVRAQTQVRMNVRLDASSTPKLVSFPSGFPADLKEFEFQVDETIIVADLPLRKYQAFPSGPVVNSCYVGISSKGSRSVTLSRASSILPMCQSIKSVAENDIAARYDSTVSSSLRESLIDKYGNKSSKRYQSRKKLDAFESGDIASKKVIEFATASSNKINNEQGTISTQSAEQYAMKFLPKYDLSQTIANRIYDINSSIACTIILFLCGLVVPPDVVCTINISEFRDFLVNSVHRPKTYRSLFHVSLTSYSLSQTADACLKKLRSVVASEPTDKINKELRLIVFLNQMIRLAKLKSGRVSELTQKLECDESTASFLVSYYTEVTSKDFFKLPPLKRDRVICHICVLILVLYDCRFSSDLSRFLATDLRTSVDKINEYLLQTGCRKSGSDRVLKAPLKLVAPETLIKKAARPRR